MKNDRRDPLHWPTLIVVILSLASAQAAHARKYAVLYTFEDTKGGEDVVAELIRDEAGNLYGNASRGGDASCFDGMGCGLVFRIDKTGKEIVLHTFEWGSDGAFPYAALAQDAAGNLYGTAAGGGDLSKCGGQGCGVIFKLDADRNFTVVYDFPGGADGASPRGLALDTAGNIYGAAIGGGDASNCTGAGGCGILFKLDTIGKETVLHTFSGGPDGAFPSAVILDKKGNLYGVTPAGGDTSICSGQGCGVVYKLSATGKFSVLHTFEDQPDGAAPSGKLVRDSKGNLYGTTAVGGNFTGGTVFRVYQHIETVLHSFKGPPSDGSDPSSGVVRDAQNNLYGTTTSGGTVNGLCETGCGTIFEIDASGNETLLHKFNPKLHPENGGGAGGLTIDAHGNLYGTTGGGGELSCGGGFGCGVVFKLIP